MKKNKRYKEVIEILKHLRFPQNRGAESVHKYLSAFYEEYKKNINDISFIEQKNKKTIEEICDGITKCLKDYDNYSIKEAYVDFFKIMKKAKENLLVDSLAESYYRIRPTIDDDKYSSLQILHIPFTKRFLCRQFRFSLPGIPCTYMSTQPTVAWYESNLIKKFHIAKYDVNKNIGESKKHKILRLNLNPLHYYKEIERRIINGTCDKELDKQICKVCVTIPLIVACTLIVKNKNAGFIEEYIIPQMLMSWIRQDKALIGIAYRPSCSHEEIRNSNAHNIVIPARDFDDDGYCKFLKSLFINCKHKTVRIDTIKKLESLNDEIDDIYNYYESLKFEYQTSKDDLPYKEILTICDTLITCWENINDNYDQTAILAFKSIYSLWEYGNCIIDKHREEDNNLPKSINQFKNIIYEVLRNLKSFENNLFSEFDTY